MVDFKSIQDKWQEKWASSKVFKVHEDLHKKKFYCLEMFPYPSASFLHMGHLRNYSIGDVIARFKRMNGYNVLYPMGYDSFGLPAENAAKKAGIHPREYTESSIAKIVEYQKKLGLSYDWDRMIASHTPEYYKWNQYFFIKFFEKGLVYRKKARVNYCPNCQTVLANEEVEKGRCWRCETEVIDKDLDQWFFKITAYADELLRDLEKLKWSDRIKTMQENWIGKSYGTLVNFKLENGETFPIFTTRPDTIYGVTFMVIALNHPKLKELIKGTQYEETVQKFVDDVKKAELAEDMEFLEKNGVFTGLYAINPLTNDKVPIYAGNFVVADYATGMIMAVPGHDERDFEFAKKYNIPIKQVIAPNITLSGKNALREHVETMHRKTVTAIVEHWSEDKFLVIKEPDNQILVGGGIEKDETPEQAIARELKEETGYENFEIKERIIDSLFASGYRISKNKNQKSEDVVFYIRLKDDKRTNSEADTAKHKTIWLGKKDLVDNITFEHHKLMCELLFKVKSAYVDDGVLVNSGPFNGLSNKEAVEKISEFIEHKGLGKKTVQYKLKDWLISRQRYWGTPIPMIYCEHCGIVPVPITELPLLLPEDVNFNFTGNPILTSRSFKKVKCPKCEGDAVRETDTMGGFMDSSWYFLRYCSPKSNDVPFDGSAVKYWMPVDQYVGGIEHAVGHLMYARFFTKVLRDMGMLGIDEPFSALFNQGVVYKDGRKMSKSFGNTVTQDEIVPKYGIDTARAFMLSVAAPDKDMEWNDKGIEGTYKLLLRLYKLFEEYHSVSAVNNDKDKYLISKMNLVVKNVTDDIENFRLSNAFVAMMDYVNYIYDVRERVSKGVLSEALVALALIINPFAPHLSEECHSMIGGHGFSSTSNWPRFDDEKINLKLHFVESMVENTKKDIVSVLELSKISAPKEIELIVSEKWKYDFYSKVKELVDNGVRNVSELSKDVMNSDLKRHGQEIMKVLPKIIDKLPSQVLDQDSEKKALDGSRSELAKTFNCGVVIVIAEDSKEAKAKQASPGKPAIVVR